MPAIPHAPMAKTVLPPEVASPIEHLHDAPNGLGRPLFQTLVPYGVHLAISIYDDRKDQLIRNQLADKADELDASAARCFRLDTR